MSKKSKRSISYLGIGLCFAYLLIVIIFIATGSGIFLTLMEILTMASALFFLLFLQTVLVDAHKERSILKHGALIAISGCIMLTIITHFVNLTITRPIMAQGVDVPLYFQIGQWPSVEMALDYLSWGLFLGIALICTALTIPKNNIMKITLLSCGFLCLVGFIGPIIGIVDMWYIAVMGYTVGAVVLCIIQIINNKERERNE